MKTVYSYHPDTRAYLGAIVLDDSDKCQITGVWHVPACCLEEAPPDAEAGTIVIADGSRWAMIPLPGEEPVEVPPEATPAEQVQVLTGVVNLHLDAMALSLRFDSMADAVSFAGDKTVPKFYGQACALLSVRSLAWEFAEALFDDILAGRQIAPTAEEMIERLPRVDQHIIDEKTAEAQALRDGVASPVSAPAEAAPVAPTTVSKKSKKNTT